MKTDKGVNRITEDVYFIAQPMGNILTGAVVLIGGRVALVDTGMPPLADEYLFPLLPQLGKRAKEIDIIVNTHWHGDHVGCNKQIKEESGATVAIHVLDKPCLESVEGQRAQFYDRFPKYFPPPILASTNLCRVDLVLRAGDKLKLGKRRFEVIHLPGHTPGSIALYDPLQKLLLSGDSIQGAGIEGHIAMVTDVDPYLKALREVEKHPIECVVMDHPYSPFESSILMGAEVPRLFRESAAVIEQYIAGLQTLAAGRKQLNLVEATDFLCANYGTRPRSLMAMCTADSILRRLGVTPE